MISKTIRTFGNMFWYILATFWDVIHIHNIKTQYSLYPIWPYMSFKRTILCTWAASDPPLDLKQWPQSPHWDRACHARGNHLCHMPCSRFSSYIPNRKGRKRPNRLSVQWKQIERRQKGRSPRMIHLRIQPCHLRELLQLWMDIIMLIEMYVKLIQTHQKSWRSPIWQRSRIWILPNLRSSHLCHWCRAMVTTKLQLLEWMQPGSRSHQL